MHSFFSKTKNEMKTYVFCRGDRNNVERDIFVRHKIRMSIIEKIQKNKHFYITTVNETKQFFSFFVFDFCYLENINEFHINITFSSLNC